MVQLSFIEEIKDKASRLIPTAYMEIVEECTAPHLLIPTYEHVKFLCETVNKKPEAIVDVVRALRRRIADNDVAVKHLTVQLLESMIKNSSTAFHIEVASQKGLLRDLVNVACMQPTTGRAMQAKEAALLLTLNLTIWFRGHPAEECYILTTLASDVRNQLGPNCFEGIEPERNTRVRVQVPPAPARSNAHADPRAAGARKASGSRPAAHRAEKRNVVDAIPVNLPTAERISAMLDVCMTFSEYLNNAEMNADAPLTHDDVVQSYLSQVRADHEYVTLLLSSNLQLDRDVLRTVGDSQSALLAKVQQASAKPAGRPAAPPTQSTAVPASAVQRTPVRSAVDTEGQQHREQQQQQQHPHTPLGSGATAAAASHATPPRAQVAVGDGFAAAPLPQVLAPSVDDLFGDAGAAMSVSASKPAEATQPSTSSSVPAPAPSPQNASAHSPSQAETAEAAPVPAPAPAVEEEEEEEEVAAPAPELAQKATEEAVEEAVENAEENAEEAGKEEKNAAGDLAEEEEEEETADEPAAPAAPEVSAPAAPAAPAPAAPAAPAAAAPAPSAAAPPKDDDDFDAFLEGRMGN